MEVSGGGGVGTLRQVGVTLPLLCREGLVWVDIHWKDNGECLDLIEKVRPESGSDPPESGSALLSPAPIRQSPAPLRSLFPADHLSAVSIETGSPGAAERGESLPQSH